MDFRDTIKQLLNIPGMELDAKTGVVYCAYQYPQISTDYCVRVRVAPSIQLSSKENVRIEMDVLIDSPISILDMSPSQALSYVSLHIQAADTAYKAMPYVEGKSWDKEEYRDFLAETNFIILEVDIKREWFRKGTDLTQPENAMRLTHLPSGIKVRVGTHNVKYKNQEEALRLLKIKVARHVRTYGEDWKEKQVT